MEDKNYFCPDPRRSFCWRASGFLFVLVRLTEPDREQRSSGPAQETSQEAESRETETETEAAESESAVETESGSEAASEESEPESGSGDGTEASSEGAEASSEVTEQAEEPEYKALDYVTLGQYKGLEVTLASTEVTEDDIQARYESDCNMNDQMDEITEGTTVQEGDIANIDYEGTLDGKPLTAEQTKAMT